MLPCCSSTRNWRKRLPTLHAAHALLERATSLANQIADSLADSEEELKDWGHTLKRNCEEHLEELRFLAPWLALPCEHRSSRREEAQGYSSHDGEEDRSLLTSAATKPDEMLAQLGQAPTLREVANFEQSLSPLMEAAMQDLRTESSQSRKERQTYLTELSRCLREAADHARQRLLALETLAQHSDELAAMDFTFLFDPARDLFSIGFDTTEGRRDTSFYDLLASEARVVQLRRYRLGASSAGPLVLDGPSARRFAGRADPGFVERFDVRISDAAAGHAQL